MRPASSSTVSRRLCNHQPRIASSSACSNGEAKLVGARQDAYGNVASADGVFLLNDQADVSSGAGGVEGKQPPASNTAILPPNASVTAAAIIAAAVTTVPLETRDGIWKRCVFLSCYISAVKYHQRSLFNGISDLCFESFDLDLSVGSPRLAPITFWGTLSLSWVSVLVLV